MNLDTTTLVHVGTELVLLTGLAFWLHRKIALVEAQNIALEQKIKALENIVMGHDAFLRQLVSPPSTKNLPPPRGTPPSGRGLPPVNPSKGSSSAAAHPKKSHPPKQIVPPQPQVDSDDGDDEKSFNDEDVDALIGDELKEIEGGDRVELFFDDVHSPSRVGHPELKDVKKKINAGKKK